MTDHSIQMNLASAPLELASREIVTAALTVASRAVARQTRRLERDLEDATRRIIGGDLWKAWKSDAYPRDGRPAYAPKGEVYLNGKRRTRGAIEFWTQPGENRNRRGGFLAIPTPAAGVNTRSRSMTPSEWQERTGIKLRYVPGQRGKAARLVAPLTFFGRNGRGVRRATSRRAQSRNYGGEAQRVDETIFVLIPVQRHANKFAIEPIHARRQGLLEEDIQSGFDIMSANSK